MKRMEELIHLNKKINFEGKVNEVFVNVHIFFHTVGTGFIVNILDSVSH